ncbi:AAA family ATPase [Listeria monocytogenes]|nr:AAA family ATPase [Listeria monocytogenes]
MNEDKKGKVISFINMKGGVGKTTLTIGIADYIANLNSEGKKVLVIDADPQFNATQSCLDEYYKDDYYEDIWPNEKTIYKLFRPQTDLASDYTLPTKEDLIIPLTSTLDILCGDLKLVLANNILTPGATKRLKRFIKDNQLRNIYDYILIDCPPTLTMYTNSALLASDYYIIPNRIDKYSIIGISSLMTAISGLIREEELNLKCMGMIYTMIENTLSDKQLIMKNTLEEQEVMENISIFLSSIRNVKDIQVGKQGPFPTKYKKSREDISDIVNELFDKIGREDNEE